MRYPTIYHLRIQQQIQGLEEQIAKLKKQNKMLHAGGIEAVIIQNNREIIELEAELTELKEGGDPDDKFTSDSRSPNS